MTSAAPGQVSHASLAGQRTLQGTLPALDQGEKARRQMSELAEVSQAEPGLVA